MIIFVDQLKEGVSEQRSEELDPQSLEVEFVDFHYVGKIFVDGIVEKNYHTLTFHGKLRCHVEQVCARCLKTSRNVLSQQLDCHYDITGVQEIDTLPDVRDELMLARPDQFLCQGDCRGLCPQCGTDLNIKTCQCKDQVKTHPFADLAKKLKEKKS